LPPVVAESLKVRESPIERKLPGVPEDLLRTYEDMHRGALLDRDRPLRGLLWDLYYPKPEDVYHWRVQRDCGCVKEMARREDDTAWLSEWSDHYPLDDSVKLPAGQWVCYARDCPTGPTLIGGPVRDIVEWTGRRDEPHVLEPFEINGVKYGSYGTKAVWDVVLSCGHYATQHAELDWKPQDGPAYMPCVRPLEEFIENVCSDPDEEDYWRRAFAENHPEPAPFMQCCVCTYRRSVIAYQRVGWLAPKQTQSKPGEPRKPARKTLEKRLRKVEDEAARIRDQLDELRSAE
jgi:hypothetical protein